MLYTIMKTEKTDNELIAEFVGWELGKCFGESGAFKKQEFIGRSSLELFQTSWDWLMPVVEKIESLEVLGIDSNNNKVRWIFSVVIKNNNCTINRDIMPQYYGTEEDFLKTYSSLNESKIKDTFDTIVKFIKWYNTNQNAKTNL